MRVAVILRRNGEEGLEQMLLVFIEQRGTPPARLVFKRAGVVVLGVPLDPIVDRLPCDAEHTSNVGGRATMVELQNREGLPEQSGIARLCQLTPEPPPLPGSEVEPAHGFLL